MSEQMGENDEPCAHRFVKDGWQRWETWLPRRKWRCILCGFETRTYDSVDHMAMRPVHPHMSVAIPGVNTLSLPPANTEATR